MQSYICGRDATPREEAMKGKTCEDMGKFAKAALLGNGAIGVQFPPSLPVQNVLYFMGGGGVGDGQGHAEHCCFERGCILGSFKLSNMGENNRSPQIPS